jgi:16S rRNA (cytosine967-C5)-methyltransferase
MTLRVNGRRHRRERLSAAPAMFAGLAVRDRLGGPALLLERPLAVDVLPGFADGLVSIQDAGAQRAAEILAPTMAGQRVLDACCGTRGQDRPSTGNRQTIDLLALDVDGSRTRLVEDNLLRLGLPATVRVGDCTDFRRVVGWPTVRCHPRRRALLLLPVSCVAIRTSSICAVRAISGASCTCRLRCVDQLWPLLKAGGKLLYATCSVFPEENGAQIDAFLVRQAAARRLTEERLLPQGRT